MIKLLLIGRLGKDCTTNNVNGNNVINFTVVHSEKFKDASGQQKEKAVWADCSYWTERQGIVPYLKKGVQVYVEGTPDVRAYTTNEGKNGASLVVRVSNVQLLGSKSENEGGGVSGGNSQQSYGSGNMGHAQQYSPDTLSSGGGGADIDDLPF